jgi:hypothetical protein
MDPKDAPLVSRAEPEFVGGDRTDLGTLHERRDKGSKPAEGVDGGAGVPAVHQVLALDLGAAARGELEQEMGQPLIPRTCVTELGSAMQRIIAARYVQFLRCREPATEMCGREGRLLSAQPDSCSCRARSP